MTAIELSRHDINVLEKIKDPESNPTAGIIIDDTLPRDPHIIDSTVYDRVVEKERQIIQSLQKLEIQLSQSMAENGTETAIQGYKDCASELGNLISEYPNYASARNNRAQVVRRLYGDAMLMSEITGMPMPLVEQPDRGEKRTASAGALADLEQSILLLSPPSLSTPISPQAARTLSMAHTQRAAIYLKMEEDRF